MSGASVGELGERKLVQMIREVVGSPTAADALGPGDDAAVLSGGAGQQAWSVDRQREGVHFESDWLGHDEIGRRAVTIAASDIWAMGAEPRWVLCALELPAAMPVAVFETLIRGLHDGAEAAGAEIVGGDIGLDERLALVTTVGGRFAAGQAPLLRSGARPGDELWVVGELGRAAAGRMLLAKRGGAASAAEADCVAAFRRPHTPTAFCRWAATSPEVHAMMDVSDGLGIDLHRLCEESGVGADVLGDTLTDTTVTTVAASLGWAPIDLVLQGGDDYAMLCAIGPGTEAAAVPAGFAGRRIGAVTADGAGIVVVAGGARSELPATGWDPFRGDVE